MALTVPEGFHPGRKVSFDERSELLPEILAFTTRVPVIEAAGDLPEGSRIAGSK